MPYHFRPFDREQMFLLPPSLADWLPEDHLAYFIADAVEQLDLRAFFKGYREDGTGCAAYHPRMMVALLLYGYCTGTRSSRKIERACLEDVAFRILAANQRPDHATLCRFRQEHEQALEALFTEVLRLCHAAGLVQVGVVVLDGTTVKAQAALEANRTLEGLRAEAQRMLAAAAAEDAREDALYGQAKRGDELPEELRGRRSRRARLKECQERLEREAVQARAEQAEKIATRERAEAERGEKLRGRKPRPPEAAVDLEAKANVTDPESRIMKTRRGYVQGYNAQAVVTEAQIVIAADVTTEENDRRQLQPMLEQARANLQALKVRRKIGVALVDAGYWSAANARWERRGRPELLIATEKDWKQRRGIQPEQIPRGRIPKGLTRKERMERKLRTKRGRQLYRKRGLTVEPLFGQVKEGLSGGRCSRRGQQATRSEWRFTCAASNLLKLWRSGRAVWN